MCPFTPFALPSLPFPSGTHQSTLCVYVSVFLSFTYAWNHTVFVFLCLTYFAYHNKLCHLWQHGPWGYCAKWNKSDGEIQIPYDFTHVVGKQQQAIRDTENRLVVNRGRGEGKRGKGAHLYGDGWHLDFWWWTQCSLYRSQNIVLCTEIYMF